MTSVLPLSEVSLTEDSSEPYHWLSASPTGWGGVDVIPGTDPAACVADGALESAVYAHIQALRSLGKTRTNTAEIARALGLRLQDVERVVRHLQESEVKTIAS